MQPASIFSAIVKKDETAPVKSIAILLPDLRCGGAERAAVNLANEFSRRGHKVEILLLSSGGELRSSLVAGVRIHDFQVNRLRQSILPLARHLRRVQPDALLACMWPLTVIALWSRLLARAKTRVVVAEHTTWSTAELVDPTFNRSLARITMKLFFPLADGIVAVSRGVADDLTHFAQLDRKSVSIVYNPVVGELRSTNATALPPIGWWQGSHRRILAVGSLVPAKNYAALLEAFAKVCEQVDARLLILGEGECRAALVEKAHLLDIADRLFLPGFVRDPYPYFQHAELLVLSSIVEGLPTVIIEALEAGTPVVSTDCPSGPREILADGQYGRLVPVGNQDAMVAAILRSLDSEHDSAALMMRANDFSIGQATDNYLELFFPS